MNCWNLLFKTISSQASEGSTINESVVLRSAAHLTLDEDIIYSLIKIKVIRKSFILNNYALQELEKGNINKIVYVPNNAFTENTMDIGALPG